MTFLSQRLHVILQLMTFIYFVVVVSVIIAIFSLLRLLASVLIGKRILFNKSFITYRRTSWRCVDRSTYQTLATYSSLLSSPSLYLDLLIFFSYVAWLASQTPFHAWSACLFSVHVSLPLGNEAIEVFERITS